MTKKIHTRLPLFSFRSALAPRSVSFTCIYYEYKNLAPILSPLYQTHDDFSTAQIKMLHKNGVYDQNATYRISPSERNKKISHRAFSIRFSRIVSRRFFKLFPPPVLLSFFHLSNSLAPLKIKSHISDRKSIVLCIITARTLHRFRIRFVNCAIYRFDRIFFSSTIVNLFRREESTQLACSHPSITLTLYDSTADASCTLFCISLRNFTKIANSLLTFQKLYYTPN